MNYKDEWQRFKLAARSVYLYITSKDFRRSGLRNADEWHEYWKLNALRPDGAEYVRPEDYVAYKTFCEWNPDSLPITYEEFFDYRQAEKGALIASERGERVIPYVGSFQEFRQRTLIIQRAVRILDRAHSGATLCECQGCKELIRKFVELNRRKAKEDPFAQEPMNLTQPVETVAIAKVR